MPASPSPPRPTVHGRGWEIALVVATLLLAFRLSATHGLWVDLDVYVAGGRAILEGRPLYDVRVHGLPFTYPPFAALAFVPLTVLPIEVVRVLLTMVSVVSLAVVTWLVGRRVGLGRLPITVLVIGALGAEPVTRNLILGQINIVLMLLVVLDLLVLPRRWRGVLIGVATGVKLIPGAFVLLYALRGELSSVARAAAALAATVALGWLQPQASLSFWGGGLWDLGVGNTIVRADNQSLAGTAMRLADQGYLPVAVQAVLTLAALGLGLWGASRVADHVLRGPIQMCIMSIAALLASPVSWTHHWIWVVPVAAVLVALRSWLLLSCGAVVLWIGLIWLGVPAEGELGLEWGQQLLASSYVVLGLAAMGVMANAGRARQPRPGVNAARS